MKIAIVDDRAEDRALIRSQLEQELPAREMRFELVEFDNGEAFTEAYSPGQFAVVFLDIYMGEMSGVEVGNLLFRENPDCKIVLLTSSNEFLRESYAMRAAYYLIKPYKLAQLRQALDFCFPKPDPKDILMVHTKKGAVIVPRPSILYIEAMGRNIHIHLKDRIVEGRDKFSDISHALEDDNRFLSCFRGIMVQLKYIEALEANELVMHDGHRLPISRQVKAQATQAFYSLVFAKAPWEDE